MRGPATAGANHLPHRHKARFEKRSVFVTEAAVTIAFNCEAMRHRKRLEFSSFAELLLQGFFELLLSLLID
jgi:hypothetical protein